MFKNRYSELMHYVCVTHGYCGCIRDGKHLHVDHFIPDFGWVTAVQFAEWVMLADDSKPSRSPMRARHKNVMKEAFERVMGAQAVYALELKWGAEQ